MNYLSLRSFLPIGGNSDSMTKPSADLNCTTRRLTTTTSSDSKAASFNFPIIHALPVEILQVVFENYCTIDIQGYAENAKRYKREAPGHIRFPPFHPDQLRCRLSLVCRRWASILEKTPRVWTQLVFLDYIPRRVTINHWLNLSEPFPLELLILLWEPQQSSVVEDLMHLLSLHVSRFRLLMAEFSRDNQFRDFLTQSLFPVRQVTRMPELEILHLRQFFPPPTFPAMGSIISPRLSKLILLSGYQIGGANLAGEKLEYVHLVLATDIAQDIKYLSNMKRIRTLNIELNKPPMTVPNTAFRLEYLTTLKLAIHLPSHILSWDNITVIFEQLQFPALEVLDIAVLGSLSRRDASPTIQSLVFGKSPHIQELVCAGLKLGPEFHSILAHLQELQKLSLLSCIVEETFFKRFTDLPSSSSSSTVAGDYLCPVLKEVQLAHCDKISMGHLEQLLRLREDIVVLITLHDVELDINYSTALVSLQETYPQFALGVNTINLWTTNEDILPIKYLSKAFSMVSLLSRSYIK